MRPYLLSFITVLGFGLATAQQTPLTLPEGYTATVAVTNLQSPTHMTLAPDGRLWLTQLAGGENAGQGQVVAVELETGEREVLLRDLEKPTGLAILDTYLWLAAGNDLLRAPLSETGVGTPEVVLEDLPFNGRSNGTLTVTPDNTLLFETSGRRQGNEAQEGSGTLWELRVANPTEPTPLATGLKGAYAHTFDADGSLFITEIGDDPVNGGAPPDELNRVVPGGDYGWPQCFGQQQPAENYGGTEEACQETLAPLALFAPQSTPTSVVASPFTEDTLLVALWGPAERGVVQISYDLDDPAATEVTPFIGGLELPQSLLSLPDGSLLMSDIAAGVIYRVIEE